MLYLLYLLNPFYRLHAYRLLNIFSDSRTVWVQACPSPYLPTCQEQYERKFELSLIFTGIELHYLLTLRVRVRVRLYINTIRTLFKMRWYISRGYP